MAGPQAIATMSVADALVRVSQLVDGVFTEVARQHGLPPAQVHLLCVVSDAPVGMKEIASALGLEKSSLTGLVDRVERRGLITRARDDHDRRACRVTVTDEGARVAHACHRDVVDRLEALADGLSPADRRRFGSLVVQLTDQLGECEAH